MTARGGCPLTKYEWSRVVVYCAGGRLLQCLACVCRGLDGALATSEAWVAAALKSSGCACAEASAARAAALARASYRSSTVVGAFLNSLQSNGCDVRPMTLRADAGGDAGGRFGLTDAGDVAVVRALGPTRRRRRRKRPSLSGRSWTGTPCGLMS